MPQEVDTATIIAEVVEELSPTITKPKRKYRKSKSNRKRGALGPVDKALVAKVVTDSPNGQLTPSQERGLAMALRRPIASIKRSIEDVRDKFAESADFYLTAHREAVARGLEKETDRGLEQARLGAEWALENVSIDGTRVIDQPNKLQNGNIVVNVGLKLGGQKEK